MTLQDYQQPPPGDWRTWVFKAARDTGKTLTGSTQVIEHLRAEGRGARVGIMAPTKDDVIATCAEGATGLITLFGNEFTRYVKTSSGAEAHHYLGGYVRFLSSTDPKRWNGPQWSFRWIDEAPLCNPQSIREGDFGLRLGEHPREIWTMTPRGASRWLRARMAQRSVITTRASIYQNKHASPAAVAALEEMYAGTTLGRAFLMGEDVDVPEGAIWPMLAESRADYLIPMPTEPAPAFTLSGAGGDWGMTVQHLAALIGGSIASDGTVWIRKAWGSPTGSSHAFIKALRGMRDSIGANFCAYDRSQGSLEDWIIDARVDADGEPIGAGMHAVKGDRAVEWRVGLVLSLLEKKKLFFDASCRELVDAYETLASYHRDDDGDIVEEEDDYADALCYLISELTHPAIYPTTLPGATFTERVPLPDVVDPNKFREPFGRREPSTFQPGSRDLGDRSTADYGGRA